MTCAPQGAGAGWSREGRLGLPRGVVFGRFSLSRAGWQPLENGAESRRSIGDEIKERIELARSKNLGNRRINVAKQDAAAVGAHQALQGHEIPQCRGPGKAHAAQVDE